MRIAPWCPLLLAVAVLFTPAWAWSAPPEPAEAEAEDADMARLLLAASDPEASFGKPRLYVARREVRAELLSVLGLGQRLCFVVSVTPRSRASPQWKLGRFRLEAVLEGGERVPLSLVSTSRPLPGRRPWTLHVLCAAVPGNASLLLLALEEEGAQEDSRTLLFTAIPPPP